MDLSGGQVNNAVTRLDFHLFVRVHCRENLLKSFVISEVCLEMRLRQLVVLHDNPGPEIAGQIPGDVSHSKIEEME